MYCNKFPKFVHKLGLSEHDPSEWRLFIDAAKRSLKGVPLHNENVFGPVPVAHSVLLKESYENLKTLPFWVKYQKHDWQVCGNLRILSMLLGQQCGYTKYPCFMCEWNYRA